MKEELIGPFIFGLLLFSIGYAIKFDDPSGGWMVFGGVMGGTALFIALLDYLDGR